MTVQGFVWDRYVIYFLEGKIIGKQIYLGENGIYDAKMIQRSFIMIHNGSNASEKHFKGLSYGKDTRNEAHDKSNCFMYIYAVFIRF